MLSVRSRPIITLLFAGVLSTIAVANTGATPQLYKALRNGKLEKAAELIERGRAIDEPDKADGWTPLMVACEQGYFDIAMRLIERGADAGAENDAGGTPLLIAIYNRHSDIGHALLEQEVEVDVATSDGWTPLMAAARAGDSEILQRLIAAGASARTVNAGGASALHVALNHRAADAASLLLEAGAEADQPTTDGWTPVMFAARNGDLENLRRLLEAGADVNRRTAAGSTALFQAALAGHDQIVARLIDAGAKVNDWNDARGMTNLMAAASQGHRKTIALLIERGADVNARNVEDDNALFIAALEGHVDSVAALVRATSEILPSSLGAEESYATAISYRAWAERLADEEDQQSSALAYRRAAEYFVKAADDFERRGKAAGRKAFWRDIGAAVFESLLEIQADARARQFAQMAALRQAAAGSSVDLGEYYLALRSYQRIAVVSGGLSDQTDTVTEELQELKHVFSDLAEQNRLAASRCRKISNQLALDRDLPEQLTAVPLGTRRAREERGHEQARIVVYRLQRFGFKNQPEITLDGEPLTRLISKKYSVHFVRPGARTIRSSHSELVVQAEYGKTYYVRGRLVSNGGGEIELVEESTAEREVGELEPVSADVLKQPKPTRSGRQ